MQTNIVKQLLHVTDEKFKIICLESKDSFEYKIYVYVVE